MADALRAYYYTTLVNPILPGTSVAPLMLPEMKLPGMRDFVPSAEKVSYEDWKEINTNAELLNFCESGFAMKHVGKIYNSTYQEVLSPDHKFQRAFVTMENPQKKGEYRLFEIPYQHFDGDKTDGIPNLTGTGFKMSVAVEHILPKGTKEEADKIIQNLSTHSDQARNLVKDKDGKPKVSMDFGGWNFEVGGGFNAYQIEHGGLPLQWKNVIGLEGKHKAIEEGMDALKKIGVDVRGGKSDLTIVSNSMGGFNAQLAKYKLEKDYGIQPKWENIVNMGFGNTLKQLTEAQWNLDHKNSTVTYKTLEEIGKDPASRAEATAIARQLADPANTRTTVTTKNYFSNYNINGNEYNCSPALPGSQVLILDTPDKPLPGVPKDSFIEHGKQIKDNHLLTALNKALESGPGSLSYATYKPAHNEEELLFGTKTHVAPNIEKGLVACLHGFLYIPDRLKYGHPLDMVQAAVDPMYALNPMNHFGEKFFDFAVGTSRFPVDKKELYGVLHAEQARKEREQTAPPIQPTGEVKPIQPTLVPQAQDPKPAIPTITR